MTEQSMASLLSRQEIAKSDGSRTNQMCLQWG